MSRTFRRQPFKDRDSMDAKKTIDIALEQIELEEQLQEAEEEWEFSTEIPDYELNCKDFV